MNLLKKMVKRCHRVLKNGGWCNAQKYVVYFSVGLSTSSSVQYIAYTQVLVLMLAPSRCRPFEAWRHTGCQRLAAPHWLGCQLKDWQCHTSKDWRHTGFPRVFRHSRRRPHWFPPTAGATQGAPLAPTCALDQLDLFEQFPLTALANTSGWSTLLVLCPRHSASATHPLPEDSHQPLLQSSYLSLTCLLLAGSLQFPWQQFARLLGLMILIMW